MRVIIAGNRDFNNKAIFDNVMTWLLSDFPSSSLEIISGNCEGADAMGEEYAKRWDIPLKIFPADWDKFGKSAGPIRNRQMAEYASEENNGILIAFWDGSSRGTKNMIDEAFKKGLDVHVFRWNREGD